MKKKLFGILAGLMIVCALAYAQNTLVYLEQGGAKQVVLSGGEIEVRSGGTLDIQSGATLTAGSISRATLTEDALKPYAMPISQWYSAADAEPLVTAIAADKFNIAAVGTGVLGFAGKVAVEGVNTTESPTMAAQFILPAEYVSAGDVSIIVTAKVTNVADTKTIDVLASEINYTAGTLGADICATAVQNVTTSFVDYTFVITATGLVAGDGLQITVNGVVTDAAGGTTTGMQITGIRLVCDVKG
jgi:hypothetical protein